MPARPAPPGPSCPRFNRSARIHRAHKIRLRLAVTTVAALINMGPTNAGTPVSGSIVYTGFFDQPRALLRSEFIYDGKSEARLGTPTLLATLPGLADGIVRLPEEGLAVGCGTEVAFVNLDSGTVQRVSAGIQDAYHIMLDASGTNVWTGNGLGLSVVPATPPGPGSKLPFQEDNVIPESVAWLGYRSVFFAADGVFGSLDPFDPNGFTSSPVPGRAIAGPALVVDPWTEDLFLAGGRWIQQLRVVGGEVRLMSSLLLPAGVDLDHIDLDGRGHFFGANARGTLIFIDYSSNGLIGSPNHFLAQLPIPRSPGQTDSGSIDGVLFIRGADPDDGGGPGGGGGPPPTPPEWESELLHWWPGDGIMGDLAGDRPLSPVGTTDFARGAIKEAFHLANDKSWLTAAPGRDWDLGSRDFTFSVWVWFDHLEPEGGLIGNYDPDSDGNHGRWVWEIRERRLRFFTSRGAGNTGSVVAGPEFDPLARRWYHLALTKKGSAFQFFINGRLRRETNYPILIPPEPGPLSIGPLSSGGRMDEILWFKRPLTRDEVASLYLAGDRMPRRPTATIAGREADQLRLSLRTLAGRPWILERSTNLLNWDLIGERVTSGTAATDLNTSAGGPNLFFRVRPGQ
ncbi:MAG TPA: LamG domain-containing protein [Verrucomicrobiota bacterium]|nr:hypothetical protein [Verrucomicrobiales bacterium]HRI14128.1 LamG domain-containing protein [Verrucomicrobiota bacterium]